MSRPIVMPPDDRGTLDYEPIVKDVLVVSGRLSKTGFKSRLDRVQHISKLTNGI